MKPEDEMQLSIAVDFVAIDGADMAQMEQIDTHLTRVPLLPNLEPGDKLLSKAGMTIPRKELESA